MAAKVETAEQEQTNTIDPARLKKELARVEDAIEAKVSHCMKHVESCKPFNDRIANAYEIASKAAGVSTKILKVKVKEREHLRKAKDLVEDLEDDARETFEMVSQALGDFGDLPLGHAAKERAAKAEGKTVPPAAEQPKKPRGRPRKAPSPDAAPASAEPKDAPAPPSDLAGLDPRAVAETDDPTYQRGHKTGISGGGCLVPTELTGLFRDRWHAGWHAGNTARNSAATRQRDDADREKQLADARAAEENATRLKAGISPLH